jgi:hypothetical protein
MGLQVAVVSSTWLDGVVESFLNLWRFSLVISKFSENQLNVRANARRVETCRGRSDRECGDLQPLGPIFFKPLEFLLEASRTFLL